ncbi:hypothetical protein SDJN02_14525, partial [Cucurbita argyrosperma subsp. argyrosperma]
MTWKSGRAIRWINVAPPSAVGMSNSPEKIFCAVGYLCEKKKRELIGRRKG